MKEKYPPEEIIHINQPEIRKINAIVALSFGSRDSKKPGLSNQEIADFVKKLYQSTSVPLILQREIAECLKETPKAKVIYEHRIKGKYLDTYEVLYQAKQFCDKFKWKNILLIAHPDHLPRARLTAKKLGFNVYIPYELPSISYDKQSIKPWTRERWRFLLHELKSGIIYKIQGKI
ncbi:YdcF family protein [bacterium]|nr:YdcF family protein [bacterium]